MSKSKHSTSAKTMSMAGVDGGHLAQMLAASSFSDADKERWVTAVPNVTGDQLKRFEQILLADMEAQSVRGVEDVVLAVKAVEHKRDLSLLALNERLSAELDEIEKSLST